jgi:hypothetical protein
MTFNGNSILGLDEDRRMTEIGHPWPNPVSEQINIPVNPDFPSDIRVTVFDLTGRMIDDRTISVPSGESSLVIQSGAWKPGAYFVSVYNGNTGRKAFFKVIKK